MRPIDADRLLEILEREEAYHSDIPQRADGIRDAIMDVMSAPTVDAVPVRHGRWIDETFKPWGLVHHPYKCDQCGDHSEAPSDYCPHCGARMDGDGNG